MFCYNLLSNQPNWHNDKVQNIVSDDQSSNNRSNYIARSLWLYWLLKQVINFLGAGPIAYTSLNENKTGVVNIYSGITMFN